MANSEEETTSIVRLEEMSLQETQMAEQLYSSAGLDPVVDAGLKDYDQQIQTENKFINKVFGTRGSDIRGYGEAVAKRVALAVYGLLNRQYGGKVGDLREYILTLEDERNRANTRYDDLMGRVVGILGDEYKDLRADSKEFMERLTTVLGEDLKESKIDQKALADRLADIDGLRSQISTLTREKEQLKEKYEEQLKEQKNEHKEELKELRAEMTALQGEHKEEVGNLRSQIAELEARVAALEKEKTALTGDLTRSREDYSQLRTSITTLAGTVPDTETGKKLGEELYSVLLKDSKVPDKVIEGVGKFIDFKKYLGMASDRGAQEVSQRLKSILETMPKETKSPAEG